MRGITVVEVKCGEEVPWKISGLIHSLGLEILSAKSTPRPDWIAYALHSKTPKYKIVPVPGYTFLGMNFSGGKAGARAKWKATHPQTFPSIIYRPLLLTSNLTTEVWYDVVRGLLEAGAVGVKVHKRQFTSLPRFERYCDELGVWRIIQAERGLNT
jgi:hypothetical protein